MEQNAGCRAELMQPRIALRSIWATLLAPENADTKYTVLMRFRLTYEGERRSNRGQELPAKRERLASHKHTIRKVFHRQLRHLWEVNEFLSTHRVFPSDYGVDRLASDAEPRWAVEPDQKIPLVAAVASNYHEFGYHFVPLVRDDWKLLCSLDILFLRHDPPGSAVTAGDLDNRVKTLIDALRKPRSQDEMGGHDEPGDTEHPFFCLLEDDRLITGLSVETDRLLEPLVGNTNSARSQVHVVITIDVRPYTTTMFNLSFA